MVRSGWSPTARRLGTLGGLLVLVVGVLYLGVILTWVLVEGTPREPIGDPYLAVMEVLTIVSALGLVALAAGLAAFVPPEERALGLATLVVAGLAAGLTMAVHFVQLTAVRQMWRAGEVVDYRLVWPSWIFAVEYFAWDVLVGLTMVLGAGCLAAEPTAAAPRRALVLGGALCLMGVAGPASGRMGLQNLAVAGYAVVLPVAAALLARLFAAAPAGAARAPESASSLRPSGRPRAPRPG